MISRKGKVLGIGKCDGVDAITELISDSVGGFIDPMLNEKRYIVPGLGDAGDLCFGEKL